MKAALFLAVVSLSGTAYADLPVTLRNHGIPACSSERGIPVTSAADGIPVMEGAAGINVVIDKGGALGRLVQCADQENGAVAE